MTKSFVIRDFLARMVTSALLGVIIGGSFGTLIGYRMGMHGIGTIEELVEQPIEVRVTYDEPPDGRRESVVLPSPGSGAALFTLLTETAGAALRLAEFKVQDAADLPTEAAKEFVKSLSAETGAQLAEGFASLIEAGFRPSKDTTPEENAQVLAGIFLTEIMPEESSPAVRRFVDHVIFEENEAVLTGGAYQVLQRARDAAAENHGSIVLLSAHTDTTGDPLWNAGLAKRRSATVRAYLLNNGGLSPDRIFSTDLATQKLPIITNLNVREPRNRIVTIEVRNCG